MKKNLLFLLVAVFTFGLAACSDDDDDKDLAKEIAGTYNGKIDVTVGEAPAESQEDQNISITYKDANSVDLELKNFNYGPIAIGDIQVNGVNVKDFGDGKIGVTGAGVISKDVLGTGTPMDLNITIAGTVIGTNALITIGVKNPQVEAVVGAISVLFTGTKK